jgi:hypothetical protein
LIIDNQIRDSDLSVHQRGERKVGTFAASVSVRDVLASLEAEFSSTAAAIVNGEFALWLGSGISSQAPSLGGLIERAVEFLRQKAIDPPTASAFTSALEQVLALARQDPAALRHQYSQPFDTWPQKSAIIGELWNKYSDLLDIRISGEADDYILWDAVDIRAAFAHPNPPAAEHLCIGILIMEGSVRSIASANWDGFIEAAVVRLSNGSTGILQVIVDPNHLREPQAQARLLKFHGCIVYADREPATFRKYLTGSRTQITEWRNNPDFQAMINAMIALAANQKALVIGLSFQDANLQGLFSDAKRMHAWPWPCSPNAPGQVFCGNQMTPGQENVLKIVYGGSYNPHLDDIHAATFIQSYGEQVLIALVLKVIADKLIRLMELTLAGLHLDHFAPSLSKALLTLRNSVADFAVPDRTQFVNAGIAIWSRIVSVFRSGLLPATPESYEFISAVSLSALQGDPNAQAAGLGRLGVVLSLLQRGQTENMWVLGPPTSPDVASGVLIGRGNRIDADDRPIFIVRSAGEAVRLLKDGAFSSGQAVVIHGDDIWHTLAGATSARQVSTAPGRTGILSTTHVSLGMLLSQATDVVGLQQQFAAGVVL